MSVTALAPVDKLPVPVLDHPHWRVNFRPASYDSKRVATLSDCLSVLEKTKVNLRGWTFPQLPPEKSGRDYGDSWIAAWSDFMGHLEYWRFYQSTQFLYLGSVREVTEEEWAVRIRDKMKQGMSQVDIDNVPGFLALTESLYNITEYFEFAARLAQAEIYVEPVTVSISVTGIAGFMLADDQRRVRSPYIARQAEVRYEKTLTPLELIATAAERAIDCAIWLFERFGWLNPSVDAIRTEQQQLLRRS